MSFIETKIEENIKFLEKYGFDVNFSKKEKVLVIEKETMFIHGIQEMLIGTRAGDAESFNILEENFIKNFKLEVDSSTSFGFRVGSRYIYFNLKDYLLNIEAENQSEVNTIKSSICFLISMHINNILESKARKENFKRIISI